MYEHVMYIRTLRQTPHPRQFKKETSTIFVIMFLEKWAFLIMQLCTHFTKPWIIALYNLNANAEDLNPVLCTVCKNISTHKMFQHVVNSRLYKCFSSF